MTSVVLDHFTSTDILLITPGTVVPGKFNGHMDDKTMVEYGKALSQVAQDITSKRQAKGEQGKVEVVNMNSAFLEAAKSTPGGLPALLTDDGLHINQAGYKVVFEVSQLVKLKLPLS
jgi:lysophospholipase L1-like esterase